MARPPSESAYTTAILGTLIAGLIAALSLPSLLGVSRRIREEPPWSHDRVVLDRLRHLRHAEESFRRVCNVGYADMQALRDPHSVIPGFPEGGAGFLPQVFARAEANGYRFALSVADPIAPTPDCPILRRFRRYSYLAEPLTGQGRFFLLHSDGAIQWAKDHAPGPEDPRLE